MTIKFKRIIVLLICTLGVASLKGQDDCVLKLNEAQKLYENGKIEKIPSLLNDCVESGFNRERRVQALRLLTLVYLFEDNTVKAENTLLDLLKIEPEYKVNQAVDPVEFIRLFNSFNTAPMFSIGFVGGAGLTLPHLIETVSQYDFNKANPKYSAAGISYSLGLKGIYHINRVWDLSIEPSFSNLSFQVQERVTSSSIATITEKMQYLNFPIYGSYYFYKKSKYSYYAEAGFSYDIFLSGKINGLVVYDNNEKPNVEIQNIPTADLRQKYNIMGSIGTGARIDLNRSNIQMSIRYKFGLMNVVNADTRGVEHFDGLTSESRYIDNDFSINNFCFMISYNREFYRHKKKPNNQTNYDVIK